MSRELNLLPPSRRKLLDNKLMLSIVNRFMRMIVISLASVVIVGLFTIAVLQGMIFTSSSLVEDNLQTNIARYQQVREEIAKKNETIKIMHAVSSDRIVWSAYFQDLFQVLPPNTTVTRIAGSSVDKNRIEFVGTAVTRNSLIVLEDRLSDLNWVGEIIAPRSNLLDRDNPTYRFDILLNDEVQEKDNTSVE